MRLIASGNNDAYNWMWAFWSFTHLIDDLVDCDKNVTTEIASDSLCEFVECLTQNKFFLENKAFIFPLIISACSRWIVGDALDGSNDSEDKIRAEVIRCGDIDVFLGISYLIGGFTHMKNCATQCSLFDNNRKA